MKRFFKFKGGVNPPENKITSNQMIEEAPLPDKVVLPLIQHAGSPAKPIVSIGDEVLAGQKIASAESHISAPIHASISGKVVDITPWMHPALCKPVQSIIIESDGRDRMFEPSKIYSDYYRYSPKDLVNIIKEAGIVGLGGAAFPTHVKLSPKENVEIDTVIINGLECESYLTSDDSLMHEHPKEIVEGIKIIMYILNTSRAFIAIEENKKEAIKELREIVFNEPNIDLAVVPVRYPQGSEKQIIKTLLNREVPSRKLPLDVGVVVDNVATTYAISRAVKNGESLFKRIVTVSGKGIKTPKNLRVRIGTLVSSLAQTCGGLNGDVSQIIIGGPMMGISQISMEMPVIKCISGILFFSKSETIDRRYYDCFRCGRCVRACPMNLVPNMISMFVEKSRLTEATEYYPLDCIECGCCSFVCPSNRPIVQQIKWLKTELAKTE